MNDLISIGICWLHIIYRAFQHGEEASKWHIKKFLGAMLKYFSESPSRTADFENVIGSGANDYPLQFCAHCWISCGDESLSGQNYLRLLDISSFFWKVSSQGRASLMVTKATSALLAAVQMLWFLWSITVFEVIRTILGIFIFFLPKDFEWTKT